MKSDEFIAEFNKDIAPLLPDDILARCQEILEESGQDEMICFLERWKLSEVALTGRKVKGDITLVEYIERMSPEFGPPEWAKKSIIKAFEACRYAPQRICISVPPRHGKTYTILHAMAKWIADFPCDTSAYATYSQKKGESKSKIIKQFALKTSVQLDQGMRNLAEWRTTKGGGLLAGGISGGGLVGEGIQGILCVDDPIPTSKKAESKTYRNDIHENFKAVVMTRLEGGSVIVIHTRWHHDDLIGRLSREGGWTIINLPAIAEEDDPIGRKPGEALDPIRYPVHRKDSQKCVESLSEIRRGLGDYLWSGLYQGRPPVRGGKLFGPPHYYDPETFDITGMRVVIGVDPAASESEQADYSVAVVMAQDGIGPHSKFYVIHVWRGQVQIPDLVSKLHMIQKKYWGAHVVVESASGFKGVAQTLHRIDTRLKVAEVYPTENKFMRAQPLAAAWSAGRILLPTDADWLADYYDEFDAFTGVDDAYDDQVDATAHAFNMFDAAANVKRGSQED